MFIKFYFDVDGDASAMPEINQDVQEKTFTQAELNDIISKRLARVEKEHAQAIEKAKAEGEANAKLSAEERAKKEQAEALAKLEEREREIARREQKATALEELGKRSLPKELIAAVDLSNAEQSISDIEKAFTSAVQSAVETRLKSEPPKDSNVNFDDLSAYKKALGLK